MGWQIKVVISVPTEETIYVASKEQVSTEIAKLEKKYGSPVYSGDETKEVITFYDDITPIAQCTITKT